MKLEHIVALAVRLFAVVLAIYALRNGISLAPYFHEQGWEGPSYLYAGFMVVLLCLSIVLWKFPLTISRGIVTFREPGERGADSASAEEIQVIGFTILGLYFLFYVLSDIIYWGFIWFVSQRNLEYPVEITLEQKGAIASTAIELIFVIVLLFGAKGIVGILHKFRYGSDA